MSDRSSSDRSRPSWWGIQESCELGLEVGSTVRLVPCSPSLFLWGQDFYSHSNWVELGKQQPHPHLLWPRHEFQSLAQGMALTPVVRGEPTELPLFSPPATMSHRM